MADLHHKYTDGDLVDIIVNEGLAYAVKDYCDSRHIEDPTTGRLWDAAGEALENLIERLKRQTGRDFD